MLRVKSISVALLRKRNEQKEHVLLIIEIIIRANRVGSLKLNALPCIIIARGSVLNAGWAVLHDWKLRKKMHNLISTWEFRSKTQENLLKLQKMSKFLQKFSINLHSSKGYGKYDAKLFGDCAPESSIQSHSTAQLSRVHGMGSQEDSTCAHGP